jgi:ubiquinol-cytochrome c reductase cytochrome c1 subunit
MRFILGFIGSVFAAILLFSMISNLATYAKNPPAPLAADKFHKEPKELSLKSDGPFGKFDKQQLQRGFQVYSEV